MKNILKNKFILIAFLAMLIIFTSVSSCFAYTITDNTSNASVVNYPDFITNSNIFLCLSIGGDIKYADLCVLPEGFNSDNIYISGGYIKTKEEVSLEIYRLNSEQTDWVYHSSYILKVNSNFSGSSTLRYSTFDIKDTDGNVVFQGAPQAPGITKALVEQANQVGMNPLLQIKTILPIILITLVSLIAFWKGLQMVSQILRKA